MANKIFIANRRRSAESLREEFGDIPVFDVTYAGGDPLLSTLSPMYPHNDLVVPFTDGKCIACSLESVWQGLKVFEKEGADFEWFKRSGAHGIKRTIGRGRGMILGHQQGIYRDRPLLNVIEARSLIYAPLYKWQLEHHCAEALALLREAHEKSDIVLLEAGNDTDIRDTFTPMVHSALIRHFLLGTYPECGEGHVWTPYTKEEHEADIERRKEERKERLREQKAIAKASGSGSGSGLGSSKVVRSAAAKALKLSDNANTAVEESAKPKRTRKTSTSTSTTSTTTTATAATSKTTRKRTTKAAKTSNEAQDVRSLAEQALKLGDNAETVEEAVEAKPKPKRTRKASTSTTAPSAGSVTKTPRKRTTKAAKEKAAE